MTELMVIEDVYGEQLDLASASPHRLGQLLLDVREHESRLKELKLLVSDELHRRMDKSRLWTLDAGPFKLSGKSDALVSVWDTECLMETLDGMVAAGEITTDAMNRAVEPRITYAVKAAGIAALLKSPELAERLESCRQLVEPADRRISVSRV